ncbi:MAG: GNAT family N-acetyltransferase [Spiroplasma sp.]
MLDFKDRMEKIIVDYFIKYNVNPYPGNDGKIIVFDSEAQIHFTNSIASTSNLNVAVSKNLKTKKQINKALEIIKVFQNNKMPFTWCVVSDSKDLREKEFFLANGFNYLETIVSMVLDLKQFNQKMPLNEHEKINLVETLEDVEKFRSVIKDTFSLKLLDLQKYYGLYELAKQQKLNYQIYLTIDELPISTGQFYYHENLVILDDIATSPKFQKQGYAKKVLFHLLNTAKDMGYEQAVLIATPPGLPVYQRLGFKAISFYIDVYSINY